MSGWVRGAAAMVAGLTMVAATGCGGLPEGVDGDLVGGWAAMPEPEQAVPAVGDCHIVAYRAEVSLLDYGPTACTSWHRLETVHVGLFTGEAAEARRPPDQRSDPWRSAYQECEDEAAAYLGADFRNGRLWLGVAVASAPAWRGGARWFRCDLVEVDDDGNHLSRSGDLRDILAAPSDLSLGCYTVVSTEPADSEFGTLEDMTAVDCTEPHHAEFVGVWHSGSDSPPDDDEALRAVHEECRELVATYLGVPGDPTVRRFAGTIATYPSYDDWRNGDRGIRCFVYFSDGGVTRSVAGAGTAGLGG